MDCNTTTGWYLPDKQLESKKSRAKHPGKLHIWGAISTRGPVPIMIFNGKDRMDSVMYTEIIEKCYLPFHEQKYQGKETIFTDLL